LSPRTLAYSAIAAALLLLLQAGVIGALMGQGQGNFQSAEYYKAPSESGTRALVRFAPEARVADITQFLDAYDATIAGGLKAGMFLIQFGEKRLTKDEQANLLKKVEREKIVSFVAPAQ